MSSHQRAVVVESDPQYIEEVTNLLAMFKAKAITARKFARARQHAYRAAFKRAGQLLELANAADDEQIAA